MLSVKQSNLKDHFLSICYDSTWDWTQVKEPNRLYYSLIAGGRIVECTTCQKALAEYEMQKALSRIRTQFSVSISYDDNYIGYG